MQHDLVTPVVPGCSGCPCAQDIAAHAANNPGVDPSSERRSHPRVPLTALAEIEMLTESHLVSCTTADLSLGGAGLEVHVPASLGGMVFMAIDAPPNPVLAVARVVATDAPREDGTARVHVQFSDLTSGNKNRLEELIARRVAS